MVNTNVICFSDNKETVDRLFKDYMFHYLSEVEGKDGFSFDASKTLDEKEKAMNKLILAEINKMAGGNFTFSGGLSISDEMMVNNPTFKWASFAIVSSLIDMIMPDVLNRTIGMYTESRYIGYGDSAAFTVESNDLFYVSKAGRDQRTVEMQKEFASQVTVLPENRAITVHANLYRTLCGLDSIANFVRKAIISFEVHIANEVYQLFDNAMSELPTTPAGGALHVTGWDVEDAIRLAQTVTAFNGGAPAVFVGTKLALRHILPADANYRYMLDSEYVKLGYIRNFMGFDVIALDQIANWENPYSLGLNDNQIYVISPTTGKPIKLVYEGASRTNTVPFYDSADLREAVTINQSYGIGIATAATSGLITLN